MMSLRKWFYKPKRDDKSLLAQFFYADEALNLITTELDSFNGRKDPERCSALVNMLRQSQDRVLTIINSIMDVLIPDERANRDFRAKFPEDVLQENLPGQLWFGAECLAAGSSIMNRETESNEMRPLAKAVIKILENVRILLREACLKNNTPNGPLVLPNNELICESLKIFDRLFGQFELNYVSAMVPVKTVQEYELQGLIGVLFSETLQRALKMKLLMQEQVDDYDPALMFTIPRLAIVSGLLIYPDGPLCIDKAAEEMSEMFRPFKNLLHKIRELLWTLNKAELYKLERLLCDNELVDNVPYTSCAAPAQETTGNKSAAVGPKDELYEEYLNQFYDDYPFLKDFVAHYYSGNSHNKEVDVANEVLEVSNDDIAAINGTGERLLVNYNCNMPNSRNESVDNTYPDYEIISDAFLDETTIVNISLNDVDQNRTVGNSDAALIDESSAKANGELNDSDENDELSETFEDAETDADDVCIGDLISNVIAAHQRKMSDSVNIPSASTSAGNRGTSSGFLLSNKVNHDDIVASLSTDEVNPMPKVNSLPDRDSLEHISQATATLSTFLTHTDGCEISADNLNDDAIKDLESPVDSGISTENVSLDRSPSLDDETYAKRTSVDVPRLTVTHANINGNNDDGQECDKPTSQYTDMDDLTDSLADSLAELPNFDTDVTKKSGNVDDDAKNLNDSNGNEMTETNDLNETNESDAKTCPRKRSKTHHHHHKSDKCKHKSRSPASACTSDTSSFKSDCADDEEIALALQAAEIANRNEMRAKYGSSDDLVHRLFVCIAGVADQLQTNFASDLRNILKSVFLINASQSEEDDGNGNEVAKDESQSFATCNGDMIEYRARESDIVRRHSGEFLETEGILAQEAFQDDGCSSSSETLRSNASSFDADRDDSSSMLVIEQNPSLESRRIFDNETHVEVGIQDNEDDHRSDDVEAEDIRNVDDERNVEHISRKLFYDDSPATHHIEHVNVGRQTFCENRTIRESFPEDATLRDGHWLGEPRTLDRRVSEQQYFDNSGANMGDRQTIENIQHAQNLRDIREIQTMREYQSGESIARNDAANEPPLGRHYDDGPPIWIPDVQAPRCMSCEAQFTVVKRRHHCRNCGKVFCARCSSNSVPLPKFGHAKPVRVCNRCFMYQLTPFTM